MGVHNWYQQEQFQETHCDYIRPVFLLYNKQNVFLGFGFQHVGKTTSPSNRYEYPDDKAVKVIIVNLSAQIFYNLNWFVWL